MKKNKLKKLSIFALTTALTVSCLAGCGKKKEEDTEQATITTEAAATMSDADIEFAPTRRHLAYGCRRSHKPKRNHQMP